MASYTTSVTIYLLALTLPPGTYSQDTLTPNGCRFHTSDSVYNVYLARSPAPTDCESTDEGLRSQLKAAQTRAGEMAYDLLQLHASVVRLMEANADLTHKVAQLETGVSQGAPAHSHTGEVPSKLLLEHKTKLFRLFYQSFAFHNFCITKESKTLPLVALL